LAPPRISKTVCNEVGFTRNGVPRIIAARYLANVGGMRHAIAINMAKPIDVLIFHSSFTEIRHFKVALECLRCSKYRKLRGRGSTTLSSCLLIPYHMISLQKVTDRHILYRVHPQSTARHHGCSTRSKSPSNTGTSDRRRSPVYFEFCLRPHGML
jgi:hypothetical protein